MYSHTLTHAPARLKSRSTLSALYSHLIAQCRTPCRTCRHHTQALLFHLFLEPVFQRAEQSCEDRRPQLSGALAEPRPFTKGGGKSKTDKLMFSLWTCLPHQSRLQCQDSVDRTPTHNTHQCSTVCSQARNASHALGSSHTDCSVIFVRLKKVCHLVLHMSHPWLNHLPFTSSTPFSSFTLPSTTTQEHAAPPVPHDLLQERPVHHAHFQAFPVNKQLHQESLWRENWQSGGNPRNTTPTRY